MAQSGLVAVLSSFNNLAEQEKIAAIQYILQDADRQRPSTSTSSTRHSASSGDSHTCSHCKGLTVINEGQAFVRGTRQHFASLYFSKEKLVQGLVNKCLLVEWIFRLLSRGLMKLKSDISDKNIHIPKARPNDSLGSVADDLDYLSTQTGVAVQAIVNQGSGRLLITYDVEPFLLDQLWDASHDVDQFVNYQQFIGKYAGHVTAYPFQVFTTHDDPAARFIPDRPPTTAIGSESSFDLARKWLHECHENHKECPKSVGILPSRVLDIGARFPIRSVKLHWTEEGESGRYAALSYCWGGLQPISSTQHTAQDFTDGILFSKFPQTLQDAMITTFKLGIRYLWIDCLCIIQDDPEDMAREIAKMAQIFEEAYVTISASSARNVNEGFLSPREPPVDSRLKLPYQTDDDGEMGSIIIEQPRQYSPEQTPISLRAWTLQEHILSPRILDYSVQELWWVCRSATLYNGSSEAQATPLSTNTQFPRAGMASLESWRSIVRDYTRRFLTYPSDKLPAISGVAAEYDKIFDGTYLAGLWQFALVSELMWSSNRSDITRPALQRAPSWSWASVDGEISHKWCPRSFTGSVSILDCRVTPVSTLSPYGSVDPVLSTLRLAGDMKQFRWMGNRKDLRPIIANETVGLTQADADEPISINSVSDPIVWGLIVTTSPTRGLVLTQGNGHTFKRVGIFYRLWGEGLNGLERKVITVI